MRALRLRPFDAVEYLLEFDLHDADSITALGDALLDLLFLALVVCIACLEVQFRQLVAELLFGLHDWLELDEDSG